jgi:HSP20 family molecular chaperone IbpA
MVLSRWSPFVTLPGLLSGWEPFATPVYRAPLDVQRTDGGFRVQAALPGFRPEDVAVTLEQGTLTISARRSDEKQTEQGRYLRREVFAGSLQRRLALPPEVGAEDVTATFENGMLTIDVRHAPASKAVQIPVGAAALPEQTEQAAQTAA